MEDGEGTVASWELRVEGRLLEDVSNKPVYSIFKTTCKVSPRALERQQQCIIFKLRLPNIYKYRQP